MTKSTDRVRLYNLLVEAEGFLELGMYQHSLRILERLPDNTDDDTAALIRRMKGDTLRMLDRHAEAIPVFEEALEQQPNDVNLLLALAWSQKRTDRIDLAAESIRRALHIEPTNPLLHYNLSCYCALLGEHDAAVESVRKAVELNPEFRGMIPTETDFDAIRDNPQFVEAVR